MALPSYTGSVDVISQLGDNPNTDNQMTAAQLKAAFDAAPHDIVQYLSTLTTAIEALVANHVAQSANIASGAVTSEKLGSDILPDKVGIKIGTATPSYGTGTNKITEGQIYLKYS